MIDLPKKGELWREVDPRIHRTIEIKANPVEHSPLWLIFYAQKGDR